MFVNKYNKTSMLKGSLTELLFDTRRQALPAPLSECRQRSQQGQVQTCKPLSDEARRMRVHNLNSSLVETNNPQVQALPITPLRNFQIKKISQIKDKVALNIQKLAERQLKNQMNSNSTKTNRSFIQPRLPQGDDISKALVTVKYPTCGLEGLHLRPTGPIETQGVMDQLLNTTRQKPLGGTCYNFKEAKKRKHNRFNEQVQEKIVNIDNFLKNIEKKNSEKESPIKRVQGSPRRQFSRHLQEQKKYQERLQREKRQILQVKKELNKQYAKPFSPPENITAAAYVVYECAAKRPKYMRRVGEWVEHKKMLLHSHKVVAEINSRAVLEMASLTKIMTCLVVLELGRQEGVPLLKEEVVIGAFQQNIGGTSAQIRQGEVYTVWQLLHGLMLPSGNDASLALAVWAGRRLLKRDQFKASGPSQIDLSSKKACYQRFISEMNNRAQELCMEKTKYANSHGLSNPQNRSCAYDIAILAEHAMNNPKFRQIVSCRQYESQIRYSSQGEQIPFTFSEKMSEVQMQSEELKDAEEGIGALQEEIVQQNEASKSGDYSTRPVRWQNTHLLLQNKSNFYSGIKTGITSTAGPCLASSLQIKGRRYILVVLNCKSLAYRFKDTEILRRWLFAKLEIKEPKTGEVQL